MTGSAPALGLETSETSCLGTCLGGFVSSRQKFSIASCLSGTFVVADIQPSKAITDIEKALRPSSGNPPYPIFRALQPFRSFIRSKVQHSTSQHILPFRLGRVSCCVGGTGQTPPALLQDHDYRASFLSGCVESSDSRVSPELEGRQKRSLLWRPLESRLHPHQPRGQKHNRPIAPS